MKKSMLVAALAALPFVAFASQLVAANAAPALPSAPCAGATLLEGGADVVQAPSQSCCIVYHMGRYYCLPC